MGLVELLFGAKPYAVIDIPSAQEDWREVRAREVGPALRAWRAEADCVVQSGNGVLKARGGEDYIVVYAPGNRGVVQADIFERTYEPLGAGLFSKRRDVTYRYFTRAETVLVRTDEGMRRALPGDWIMQGVQGELWPVPRAEAEQKYEPV